MFPVQLLSVNYSEESNRFCDLLVNCSNSRPVRGTGRGLRRPPASWVKTDHMQEYQSVVKCRWYAVHTKRPFKGCRIGADDPDPQMDRAARTLFLENLELSLISRSLRELPRPGTAVCHAVIDYCGNCRLETSCRLSTRCHLFRLSPKRGISAEMCKRNFFFSDKSLLICLYYYECKSYSRIVSLFQDNEHLPWGAESHI